MSYLKPIHYFKRRVYGHNIFYFTNLCVSNAFFTLTKHKTLTENDLKALAELGHELLEVPDPRKTLKNLEYDSESGELIYNKKE